MNILLLILLVIFGVQSLELEEDLIQENDDKMEKRYFSRHLPRHFLCDHWGEHFIFRRSEDAPSSEFSKIVGWGEKFL